MRLRTLLKPCLPIMNRHEPVLPGGNEIARAGHLNARAAAIAAGVLAVGAVFR